MSWNVFWTIILCFVTYPLTQNDKSSPQNTHLFKCLRFFSHTKIKLFSLLEICHPRQHVANFSSTKTSTHVAYPSLFDKIFFQFAALFTRLWIQVKFMDHEHGHFGPVPWWILFATFVNFIKNVTTFQCWCNQSTGLW